MQIGRVPRPSASGARPAARRFFAQENLVPVHAEVGDDAHLARGRQEFAGQVTAMVLGLPAGMPMSSITVCQSPARILHLQIRQDQVLLRSCDAEGRCCHRPNRPSRSGSARRVHPRRAAEVEIEMVQLGDAVIVAPEAVGIGAGRDGAGRQHVVASMNRARAAG